jgi:hypothetical protein
LIKKLTPVVICSPLLHCQHLLLIEKCGCSLFVFFNLLCFPHLIFLDLCCELLVELSLSLIFGSEHTLFLLLSNFFLKFQLLSDLFFGPILCVFRFELLILKFQEALLLLSDPPNVVHLFLKNGLPLGLEFSFLLHPLLLLFLKLLHLMLISHEFIDAVHAHILQFLGGGFGGVCCNHLRHLFRALNTTIFGLLLELSVPAVLPTRSLLAQPLA